MASATACLPTVCLCVLPRRAFPFPFGLKAGASSSCSSNNKNGNLILSSGRTNWRRGRGSGEPQSQSVFSSRWRRRRLVNVLSDDNNNRNGNGNGSGRYLKGEGEGEEEEEEEELSRATLIWRAVKLPMYSVALVPLTVGTAAAYLQTCTFDAGRYCLFLFSSILIITWLNLSNDAYDFDTGADKDKRESAVKISGSRSVVLCLAYICLVLGCGGLLWGGMEAGDFRVISLLFGAILCGYVYQSPPFRLSYLGLGEPLCFVAFGPLATSAFYFSQSRKSQTGNLPFSTTVLCVSLLVGLTTTLILFCSHFHQIDGDRDVGKISPLVRIGTERGSAVVKYGVMSLYLLLFAFAGSKALPLTCLFFPLLTLPVGKLVTEFVQANHNYKEKIFMAKYYCVRLHASFGAALAFGLFAARFFQL